MADSIEKMDTDETHSPTGGIDIPIQQASEADASKEFAQMASKKQASKTGAAGRRGGSKGKGRAPALAAANNSAEGTVSTPFLLERGSYRLESILPLIRRGVPGLDLPSQEKGQGVWLVESGNHTWAPIAFCLTLNYLLSLAPATTEFIAGHDSFQRAGLDLVVARTH